ncbi:MAG TPA: DMT family transporter [Myxococcota bacterium]|nr:DMT family transporter [Myxococcota bacterium]
MRAALPALWCLLAAVLFGGSTPATKALVAESSPLVLAGLLYLGAAAAVLPFSLRGGSSRWRAPRNLGRLGGAVLFGGILGPAALLYGLSMAPAASVALWLNLETVATAVLAWVFFRENLAAPTWLANLGVVLAGALLILPDGVTLGPAAALLALACICWGLDNNLTAIIDGFTPEQSTFAKGLVAGSFNLGLAMLLGHDLPGWTSLIATLAVGALGYGASIVLYIRGAQHLGATRSQMLFATAPVFGLAGAWLVLGEPIELVQIAAAAVLAVALVVMLRARHAHRHTHASTVHTHLHRHDDGHHDHAHEDFPAEGWHTHEHEHGPLAHSHPHQPDLHHRHHH